MNRSVHSRAARRRRATILLLVVSLLALLFVIITGFLALARTERLATEQFRRGDIINAVIDDVHNRVKQLAQSDIASDRGVPLGGPGMTYSQITGRGSTGYIAANAPVWRGVASSANGPTNLTGNRAALQNVVWPATSNLEPHAALLPSPIAVSEMLIENSLDNDTLLENEDLESSVRLAFMDADGDGFPDSVILGAAGATEAANVAVGSPVRLPRSGMPFVWQGGGFSLAHMPDPSDSASEAFRSIWQRYSQSRKYEVAVRVVGHGGMVSLDAPMVTTSGGSFAPLNRQFVIRMFNSIRHATDTASLATLPNSRFDELASYSSVIEPLLRRRNGLPPARAPEGAGGALERRRIPPVLALLQGEFGGGWPDTFLPKFRPPLRPTLRDKAEPHQRFNLAQSLNDAANIFSPSATNERGAAVRSLALNAESYNRNDGGPTAIGGLSATYERRGLITTVSTSDDTMLKQIARDPVPAAPAAPSGLRLSTAFGSTYANQEKFYLGEVAKCFYEVDDTGLSDQPGSGRYRYNPIVGDFIIEQLARVYYDMLSSHEQWRGSGPAAQQQAVTRRQQAIMLAVNTVAFAAPRDLGGNDQVNDPAGFIDVVTYTDVDPDITPTPPPSRYVGFAPQPFLTEVAAHSEDSDDDMENEIALAVEVFNPCDPYLTGPNTRDLFALRRDQFAVSIGNARPTNHVEVAGNGWVRLDVGTTGANAYPDAGYPNSFRGRTFGTVVFKRHSNSTFDNVANQLAPPRSFDDSINMDGPEITVRLWRRCGESRFPREPWYLVDEINVRTGGLEFPQTQGDPHWFAASRDTSPTLLYGFDRDGNYARWGVTIGVEAFATSGSGGAQSLLKLTEHPNPGCPFSPTTPPQGSLGSQRWIEPCTSGGSSLSPVVVDPDPAAPGSLPSPFRDFAPVVPLITMNAASYDRDPAFPPTAETFYYRMNSFPMYPYATSGAFNDLRPRSFPTVGFMLFIPRFSHAPSLYNPATNTLDARPIAATLAQQWHPGGSATARYSVTPGPAPDNYPADFGHMPVFENQQAVRNGSYLDADPDTGARPALPWGQLVFDYFTTIDPTRAGIDNMAIPGRININQAPWYVLSKIPMLGPVMPNGTVPTFATTPAQRSVAQLPLRAKGGVLMPAIVTADDPSPSFWDPSVGVLAGVGILPDVNTRPETDRHRLAFYDVTQGGQAPVEFSLPAYSARDGGYRLGAWLAQAAAAYRDGIPYVAEPTASISHFAKYSDAYLRNGGPTANSVYRPARFGPIRGAALTGTPPPGQDPRPTDYGFLSVGELLNVKGWDSTAPRRYAPGPAGVPVLDSGDFVKAVSVLALLDTQYLTTRTNTFTAYVSVMDRENPEASIRSQVTFDRSNLLPRLDYLPKPTLASGAPNPVFTLEPRRVNLLDRLNAAQQPIPDGIGETPVRFEPVDREPRIIAERRIGYFNTRFDD